MADTASEMPKDEAGPFRRNITRLGSATIRGIAYVGGVSNLLKDTAGWTWAGLTRKNVRFGRPNLYAQLVRLGLRSISVILLVNGAIGLILALQLAPPLDDFGQVERVADIIAVAVVRELGPLITAIVLTGFAGAAVAAELGTMVVGEEIEAMQAHALNPVRFLVVPRVIAAIVSMLVLSIIGEFIAIIAGWGIAVSLLAIPSGTYINNTRNILDTADVLTGLWKAGVFGAIIASIACYNGLKVTGGAAGVGRATTSTVVHSVVTIIFADLIFTAAFYAMGLN
jgi:phospholipid/cholesterol/gamma-HCH transport system permease protein